MEFGVILMSIWDGIWIKIGLYVGDIIWFFIIIGFIMFSLIIIFISLMIIDYIKSFFKKGAKFGAVII